jgi:hypothetical protein
MTYSPLCNLMVLILAASPTLLSQSRGAAQKEKEVSGFANSPIVFKDEACARDYIQASEKGGLEGRKSLIEQSAVGCFDKPDHLYSVTSAATRKVTTAKGAVLIRHVILLRDVDLEEAIKKRPADPDIDSLSLFGWVLDSQVLKVTRDELLEALKKQKSP